MHSHQNFCQTSTLKQLRSKKKSQQKTPKPVRSLVLAEVSVLAVLCTGTLIGERSTCCSFPPPCSCSYHAKLIIFPTTPKEIKKPYGWLHGKKMENASHPQAHKLFLWVGFPGKQLIFTVQHPTPLCYPLC